MTSDSTERANLTGELVYLRAAGLSARQDRMTPSSLIGLPYLYWVRPLADSPGARPLTGGASGCADA